MVAAAVLDIPVAPACPCCRSESVHFHSSAVMVRRVLNTLGRLVSETIARDAWSCTECGHEFTTPKELPEIA